MLCHYCDVSCCMNYYFIPPTLMDSFLFGAIINTVAVDILEYIFCCKYAHISVGYVPGSWELNRTVYICLALGYIANFPVDQEVGKGLAGWCWPRVSHVVGVRMSAGITIIWRLDWKALFQNGSLTLLLAGSLSSSLRSCLVIHMTGWLTCPRGSDPRELAVLLILVIPVDAEWSVIVV